MIFMKYFIVIEVWIYRLLNLIFSDILGGWYFLYEANNILQTCGENYVLGITFI